MNRSEALVKTTFYCCNYLNYKKEFYFIVILDSLHTASPQEIRELLELKTSANQSQSDKEDPTSAFEMLNLDLAPLLFL